MHRTLILALLLIAPVVLVSGCLNAGGDEASTETATTPAGDAGGTNTTRTRAPISAPAESYNAGSGEDAKAIHPYTIPGQKARPSEELAFDGEYDAADCTIPLAWEVAGERWRGDSFADALEAGDAVMATVTFTYENTDDAYANLHVWAAVPGQYHQDESDIDGGAATITQTLEFQFAWPGGKNAYAYVGVGCWWAENVEPIPYTLTVDLAFAENVVPAESPVVVPVDEGVRELRVTGAAVDPDAPVTGHYRLFAPDDTLVGEFALNSDESADVVPVTTPGAYVLIVDHSANGMLALGADAPPADPELVVLETDWAYYTEFTSDSLEAVDATVTLDVPRVPLRMGFWVRPAEDGVAAGKNLVAELTGPKGVVMHRTIPNFANYYFPTMSGGPFVSLPDTTGWEYLYDHHALAVGEHTLTVQADAFKGEVYRWYVTYLRPGETGVPAPPGVGDAGALVGLV